MKKIVAFLLVLAIAVPAMATVNFTAVDNGSGQLKISYASDASEAPRGIALKIALTNGATCSPTGGVVSSDAAFNTYIDYAWSAGSGYTIGSGHPLAIDGTRGPLTGAAGTFVVCMGVLDTTGNQAGGPTSTTNLITLQLVGTGSTVATISADTLRGPASGVVGSTLASNLPLAGVTVSFETVSTPTVPATTPVNLSEGFKNVSYNFTTGGSATTPPGHTVEYRFDWVGSGNPADISGWSTTLPQGHIYAAAGTYSVKAQARCTIDFTESAWSAGKTFVIVPCKGDFNASNTVTSTDITSLVTYWNNNKNAFSKIAPLGLTGYVVGMDINSSGTITSTDVTNLVTHWNNTKNAFSKIAPCMP